MTTQGWTFLLSTSDTKKRLRTFSLLKAVESVGRRCQRFSEVGKTEAVGRCFHEEPLQFGASMVSVALLNNLKSKPATYHTDPSDYSGKEPCHFNHSATVYLTARETRSLFTAPEMCLRHGA